MMKRGLLVFLLACGVGPATLLAQSIFVKKPGLYPEGVAYDRKTERFFVSSLAEGSISVIEKDGTVKTFAEDPVLVSAIGLHIDPSGERILVCNSDPGVGKRTRKSGQAKTAGLAIFSIKDGSKIAYIDLGKLRPKAMHFANDLTFDAAGNIYVTDSFAGLIYKIDTKGQPSIFAEDARFQGQGFTLNGIAAVGDALIVAKSNEGKLFRIALQGGSITEISVKENLSAADGLIVQNDKTLVVICNAQGRVLQLESQDKWASASLKNEFKTGDVFPTTGTLKDEHIFVLYAHLDKLFNPANKVPVKEFEITQISFPNK